MTITYYFSSYNFSFGSGLQLLFFDLAGGEHVYTNNPVCIKNRWKPDGEQVDSTRTQEINLSPKSVWYTVFDCTQYRVRRCVNPLTPGLNDLPRLAGLVRCQGNKKTIKEHVYVCVGLLMSFVTFANSFIHTPFLSNTMKCRLKFQYILV